MNVLGLTKLEEEKAIDLARKIASRNGQSARSAFDDLVNAIGRKSPIVKDNYNAGTIVNKKDAWFNYKKDDSRLKQVLISFLSKGRIK